MPRKPISNWLTVGTIVLRKKKMISVAVFRRFFKLHPRLCDKVYLRLRTFGFVTEEAHLLWCLFYLKSRDPMDGSIAQSLGIDKDTMRKHVFEVLRNLRCVMPKVCFDHFYAFVLTVSLSGRVDSIVGIIVVLLVSLIRHLLRLHDQLIIL